MALNMLMKMKIHEYSDKDAAVIHEYEDEYANEDIHKNQIYMLAGNKSRK